MPITKRWLLAAMPLLLASQGASAATANGNSALALAALVAANSPLLAHNEKFAMAQLFDGNLNLPKNKKISVRAEAVVCRVSNVDITSRSCDLTFDRKTVTVKGRKAHELFATIAEVGVPSEGAAGTIFESLSHLVCTIDPGEIRQESGGGADCTFDPGGP